MTVPLRDSVTLSGTRITSDGYMVTEAFAVRTGVQLYTGKEVDPDGTLGLRDKAIVRVYRPEDEVRAPDSLTTFSHAPVTMGHPKEAVTADNWNKLAVGEVSTEAMWDGNRIKLPLVIKDAAAVAAIQSGTRQLSAGYTCVLDATPGVTSDGQDYDAKQTNIRINHLAVVPNGRAGNCQIGDEWGAAPIEKEVKMTTKHIAIGDSTAEVIATDADKITGHIKNIQDRAQAAIDAKDKELATKDARIKELEAAQLNDAQLDERVAKRAQLLADAALIAPKADFKGLSDADVRKKAVVTVDAEYADKGEAYIEAMFDIALKQAKEAQKKTQLGDNVMSTVLDRQSNPTQVNDSFGYHAREKELADAWKTPQ